MEEKILKIQKNYLEKINQADTLQKLDEIFLTLFGKNGEITLVPKEFGGLSKEELQIIQPIFIKVKQDLEQAIEKRREEIKEKGYKQLVDEKLDLTESPKITSRIGHLHPVTQLEHEIVELFHALGFQQFQAPHIDTDEYNFELLNIPKGHPARDLWDTLYIDRENSLVPGEMLLRTHTSNAQIRILKEHKPPIRMMVLDRCFRYENLDPRHEHTLEQFEVVLVDKGLSMANLQYLSEYFLKAVFGKDIKVRLRPKYYPFVEPGVGVDGECIFCNGRGCKICGGVGWLELAGAGMIHPQVLRNGGLNPKIYSGIAWGFGPERMAMLKYGVNDIRQFKSGDLKLYESI